MDYVNLTIKVDAKEVTAADAAIKGLQATVKNTDTQVKTFASSMKTLDSNLTSVKSRTKDTADEVKGLSGALATGVSTLIGFASAVLGAATGISALVVSAANAIDAQDELAQKLGLTAQEFTTLSLLASENGSNVESLVKTYDKLSKSLTKMDEDSVKTELAFAKLGLTFDDIKNKRPEQVAGLIIDNYDKLGQTATATAAAMQLLGPNFREQSIAIKEAATNIDSYSQRVAEFGGVATEKSKAIASDLEKASGNLQQAWKQTKILIVEYFGEMAVAAANFATSALKGTNDSVSKFTSLIGRIEAAKAALPPGVGESLIQMERERALAANATAIKEGRFADSFVSPNLASERQAIILENAVESFKKQAAYAEGLSESERLANEAAEKRNSLKRALLDLEVKTAEAVKLQTEADKKTAKIAAAEAARLKKIKDDKDYLDNAKLLIAAEEDWAKTVAEAWSFVSSTEAKYLKQAEDNQKAQQKLREDALITQQNLREETQRYYDLLKDIGAAGNARFPSLMPQVVQSPQQQALSDRDFQIAAVLRTNDSEMTRLSDLYALQTLKGEAEAANETSARMQELANTTDKAVTEIEGAYDRLTAIPRNFRSLVTDADWDTFWGSVKNKASDAFDSVSAGFTDVGIGAQNFINQIEPLSVQLANFGQSFSSSFSDELVNAFTTGRFEAERFGKEMLTMLIRIQMQMLAMKIFGAFGVSNAASSSSLAMANGGAFQNGVQMFANGGIVSQPTMFAHSRGLGVMGEAGSEAIMPLRRTSSGRLGVEVTGSGSSGVQIGSINVTVQGGNTNAETGSAVAEAIVARIADARIQNATRNGGIIRNAFA